MKNTIIFSLILFLSVLSLSSCKVEVLDKEQGPVKTENIASKDFDRIMISYPATVIYIPSDTFSVKVKAPEKVRESLEIGVKSGTLEIKKPDMWQNDKHYIIFHSHYDNVTVTVKAPTIKYVAIAGSATFKCDTTITAHGLDLEIAGSGEIDIKNIQAQAVSASIAGSGDITLSGDVKSYHQDISGSGDMHIDKLRIGK